jgi:diguanylate cyclase (GGDEF)-like protein
MAALRHRIFQLSLTFGASTLLLSALVDFLEPHSEPFHSGLLVLIAGVFLGIAATLRVTQRLWLEQLAYAVVVLSFVFEFAFSLQELASSEPYPGMLAEVFVWAPVIYAVIFTLRRAALALRHSLIVYLVTLVMGVTFLFIYDARGLPLPLKAFGDLYLGTAAMIALLYIFVRRSEELIELRTLFKAQVELAVTDHLTGLYNRRKLQGALEVEVAKASPGQPLAVMLYDLDHFKHVNDAYGHRAGDEVLKETAQRVKRLLRASDHLGRWGGEEFLIVAPGLTLESAFRCAERLKGAIAEPIGAVGQVTASFGVAAWQPGDSAESLWARADAALYRAKAAGRDCVRTEQSRVTPAPEIISPIG